MHKKNAMYIISGAKARAEAIITSNIQKYLEFLYTVGSKIELLEPLFNNFGAATNGASHSESATMNITMHSNNAIVPSVNRSMNETLKK